MSTITYVAKETISPMFGCYSANSDLIEIRNDLPKCAEEFVLIHETHHSTTKETIWWKRELEANWAGFKKHPIGFFIILTMSFAPYRLKYYLTRFKTKN
jgi:hypothetical protein